MGFNPKNLTLLTAAGKVRIFHYKTAQSIYELEAPGYFNSVKDQIYQGNIFYIETPEYPSIQRTIAITSENDLILMPIMSGPIPERKADAKNA